MATMRRKSETYAITILTFERHRHFQRTANAELFIATIDSHTKTLVCSMPQGLKPGFVAVPRTPSLQAWPT